MPANGCASEAMATPRQSGRATRNTTIPALRSRAKVATEILVSGIEPFLLKKARSFTNRRSGDYEGVSVRVEKRSRAGDVTWIGLEKWDRRSTSHRWEGRFMRPHAVTLTCCPGRSVWVIVRKQLGAVPQR